MLATFGVADLYIARWAVNFTDCFCGFAHWEGSTQRSAAKMSDSQFAHKIHVQLVIFGDKLFQSKKIVSMFAKEI